MKPVEIFAGAGRGRVPWVWVTPILGIVFVVASGLGIELEMEARGLQDTQGRPIGRQGILAFLLLTFLALGATVLAWTRWIERRPLGAIGLTRERAGKRFAFGLLVGVLTSGGLVAAIWLAGGFTVVRFAPAFASADALAYIAVLLACFAVQSSVEEVLFRGWMLSALARRTHVITAVVIVSAVFTLLHLSRGQPPLVTLSTFLFSVFACSWVLRSRHLWSAMGWHSAWNWLIGVGFEIPITGLDLKVPALVAKLESIGPDALTGGPDGPEGSWLCVALFLAATALLTAPRRRLWRT